MFYSACMFIYGKYESALTLKKNLDKELPEVEATSKWVSLGSCRTTVPPLVMEELDKVWFLRVKEPINK